MLQSVTECYRVLQSVTECYIVLQSVTVYFMRIYLDQFLGLFEYSLLSVQLIPWCFVVKAVQILCDLLYVFLSPWLNCQSRKWMSITEINPDGSSTAPRNILNILLNIYSKSRQNLLLIINNHNQNIIRVLTNSLFWFCSWHETPIDHLDQVELRNKS